MLVGRSDGRVSENAQETSKGSLVTIFLYGLCGALGWP